MKAMGPIETVARAGGPGSDVMPVAAAAVARMTEQKSYNPGPDLNTYYGMLIEAGVNEEDARFVVSQC